jgi:hypothetical protein
MGIRYSSGAEEMRIIKWITRRDGDNLPEDLILENIIKVSELKNTCRNTDWHDKINEEFEGELSIWYWVESKEEEK